jgi:glycosyltransferase involved in cell wall biosynthesis
VYAVITVLVATFNGETTWPAVLEAYTQLTPPDGGWKLVIVDNASADGTSGVVKSFQSRLPLTYVFEPDDGKNAALNSGLAFVSGDLVVFTDDDVFPRPDWLVKLREASNSRPAFSIFGGCVLPRWEVEPPEWILNWVALGPTFAISDSSLPEGPMPPGQVFGPNMAIRAAFFTAGHRFDTAIGPRRSRNYPMGSETELLHRLTKLGAASWHVPAAIVEHYIRAHQMRQRWIIDRAVRFGRGRYRLARNEAGPALRCWGGIPRYMFRELAGKLGLVAGAALRANSKKLFQSRWELSYVYGEAVEARLMSRAARRRS